MSSEDAPRLSAGEVRRKAVRGVLAVAGREVALRVFGLLGSIVLARLLTPRDFGTVAFGNTLISFGTLVANGGVGAQLVQGADEPTVDELRSVQGISLVGTVGLTALIACLALPLGGRVGQIATVMAASLPLSALSAPNAIVAERMMLFSPSVRADITQAVSYNVVAIAFVVLGLGVWGLALALVIATAIGTGTLIITGPIGFVRPGLSWRTSKRFIRFGLQFQAASVASLVRDQGLNLLALTFGGLSVLGIWSLTTRVLQGISFVFSALFRVSFPAIARLIESGEDPRSAVQSALSLSTTVSGVAVVAIGGCAPALVPLAFGQRWHGVIAVLPWTAAGILVSGPIATTAASFLYARGQPRTVLNSILAHTLAWWVVALFLLPTLGAEALGIGWAVGCTVDVVVLARALARHNIQVAPYSAPAALAAGLAGGLGWLIAENVSPQLPALVASLVGGEVAYLAIMLLIRPKMVIGVYRTIRRALHSDAVSD